MTQASQFMQLRMLAKTVAQMEPREAWLREPVGTATSIAEYIIGQTPLTQSHHYEVLFRTVTLNVLTCGVWNTCGRPVVTLGHKTAAACAATKFYPDAVSLIQSPWPAFMVRLPVPLLSIVDNTQSANVTRDANLLLVVCLPERLVKPESTSDEPRWWFKLCAESPVRMTHIPENMVHLLGTGISLWGFNMPSAVMASGSIMDLEGTPGFQRWDTLDTTSEDTRVEELTRRLVLNTCLYVDAPNSSERIAPVREISVTRRTSKPDELGTYESYTVQAGIKLNLCDPVREYVKHGAKAPQFARMVSPHWKRVVHGTGRLQRRLQYIEAYWKGVDE